MTFPALLIQTCVIERPVSSVDAYGADVPGWETIAEDVRCRLVARSQEEDDLDYAEFAISNRYGLFVGPDTDIQARDRVTVTLEDGTEVDSTFQVVGVVQRHSTRLHHLTCAVERIGV